MKYKTVKNKKELQELLEQNPEERYIKLAFKDASYLWLDVLAVVDPELRVIDLTCWDVSSVTNMHGMFAHADKFNQDISNWDVSNVTNMNSMFIYAKKFNQDISNWDVSNVTNMVGMFAKTKAFNQDISNLDVSNVTNMSSMFAHAEAFNQDISNWDVSNVTNMWRMFAYAKSFNKPLNNWDVSSVTNMCYMFEGAEDFNQQKPPFFRILDCKSRDYEYFGSLEEAEAKQNELTRFQIEEDYGGDMDAFYRDDESGYIVEELIESDGWVVFE
jgi:surface protein